MKYYWDSRDLRKDLKVLERIFKEEKDLREKELLSFYIAHTKNLIIDQELKQEELQDDYEEEYIDYLSKTIPLFEVYYPYINRYKKVFSNCKIDNEYDDDKTIEEKNLNKDTMLELVHDFFKATNKDIYNKFLEIYKRRNKLIRFLGEENYYGSMIFIPKVNNPYITIDENQPSNRSLLITSVHELTHAIIAMINPERYVFNNFFYKEIETTFFELIANDYFTNQLDDNGFYLDEKERMESKYFISESILNYKKLIDYRFALRNPSKKEFLEMLQDYNEHMMVMYADEINLEDDMKYLFSYIVAIELYEIYKIDKELAFEMLKEIVTKRKEESEYENITRIVEPGKSLVKFRNRIFKATKKEQSNE